MRFALPIIFTIVGIIAFLTFSKKKSSSEKAIQQQAPPSASIETPKPLLGETMLADHAKTSSPPERDSLILHRFVHAATMENRHIDTFHLSTNPDLTEILLGKEDMSHPQLPKSHPILGKNQYGETVMLDRWKTPYHIHLLERDHIEVISAGPDKTMGNEDDLRWPPARQ